MKALFLFATHQPADSKAKSLGNRVMKLFSDYSQQGNQVTIFRILFLTSLDISDIDTVWTWGEQTCTPLGSRYFSKILSPNYIKLSINNPKDDFKSVKRR